MQKLWEILKLTFKEFAANRVMKLSAALAYYTIFSLPGLLMVIFWVIHLLYRNRSGVARDALFAQIRDFVGEGPATQIQDAFTNASHFTGANIATVIAVVTLVLGATSIFAEIQDSINLIWKLKAKPRKGKGWLKLIMDRLLSFSVVLSLGFLLMVSLILNTVLDLFVNLISKHLPESQLYLTYASNFLLTFIVTTILFGIIYKVLPDARIKWRTVRAGAMTTAILFMIGKYLISYFLASNKMTSAYGAAGSVIIILLWVYYTATILYFGATFTRAYAYVNNQHIYPSSYAVWVEQVEVETTQSLEKTVEVKHTIEEKAKEATDTDPGVNVVATTGEEHQS